MTTLAYSHTLVAGTPENINDVQDMFNDARTVINGNLDATNLATSAKPATLMGAYRTISEASFQLNNAFVAATYTPGENGTPSAVGAAVSGTALVIPIILADYAVSGLTTQFRVQATTMCNTVAPGMNFTFSLAPVATVGGSASSFVIATLGTLQGSFTRATPSASTIYQESGSDFTIAGNGTYVLVVATSGTPAANSNTQLRVRLQAHHI